MDNAGSWVFMIIVVSLCTFTNYKSWGKFSIRVHLGNSHEHNAVSFVQGLDLPASPQPLGTGRSHSKSPGSSCPVCSAHVSCSRHLHAAGVPQQTEAAWVVLVEEAGAYPRTPIVLWGL